MRKVILDPDARAAIKEPAIAKSTPVYDSAGQHIGEVEGVELNQVSGLITRAIVRRGKFFREETAIPASVIASVRANRITLGVGAAMQKFERGAIDQLGRARAS